MKKVLRRILGFILTVMTVTVSLGAAEESAISCSYQFTSSHSTHYQYSDSFTWQDEWFSRSASDVCSPLAELSAKVALASICRFGNGNTDPADDPDNLTAMLRDMGFADLETNTYYTRYRLTDSFAVAIGRREISVDGKSCTLLAVIPCSGGYGQEWGGNFRMGEGDLHEGFRLARDEALRFLRQYVGRYEITGDVKIWLAGHSRAGATSNLIAGFLAGGGAAYLDGIRIEPEDIYAYTFAAPNCVAPSASAQEVLSVSGARDGLYADDTPGEPWVYSGSGTILPDSNLYSGIHNFILPYDLIAALPPEAFGLTRYGTTISMNPGDALYGDAMVHILQTLNPELYADLLRNGDWRGYSAKTFDLAGLSFVDIPSTDQSDNAEALVQRMADTLAGLAADRAAYSQDGMEETLVALGGVYGCTQLLSTRFHVQASELIRPALLCFLTYAIECLEASGTISSDATESEKTALVLTELITWLTGEPMDPATVTLDDCYIALVSWLLANEDTPLGQTLFRKLAAYMENSSLSGLIGSYFAFYVTDPDTATMEEKLRAFVRATVEDAGSDDPKRSAPDELRDLLYSLMTLAGILPWGTDGDAPLTDVADILRKKLIEGTGADTLARAADASLCSALDLVIGPSLAEIAELSEEMRDQAAAHLETIKAHAGTVRVVLTHMLFSDGDTPSGIEAMVQNAATVIGNIGILPLAHYGETAVAWATVWAANSLE